VAVEKFKPKRTPHLASQRSAQIMKDSEKLVKSAGEAISRSRKLLDDSQQTVQRTRAERVRRRRSRAA
jgi:hypothetical protein